MSSLSRNSFGLAALAATSTIGAWFLYNQFKPTPPSRKNKKNGDTEPFDFIVKKSTLKRTVSDATASTLDSKELEQVWNSSGEVDVKIFRQLLEQKKRHNSTSSKVTLFDHLLNKLEQTLEERDRIEVKLDSMRDSPKQEGRPSISKVANPPDAKLPPLVVPHTDTSVCLVIQRYRGATIMCNETDCIRVGKSAAADPSSSQAFCGLMVYVSFAKGCTQAAVKAAAKIVVSLPVLTIGGWGDGSKTMNVIDLAKQHPNAASVVIVPQASLISKVKSQGRSVQYHAQIDKDEGNTLYHYFVNTVRGLVLESQCQTRKEALPEWYQKSCSAQAGSSPQRASPSIPPEDLFRDETLYSSFDETTGIPLTDAEGVAITKSAQKKMRKAQAAHRVRHLKWLRENPKGSPPVVAAEEASVASSQQEQSSQANTTTTTTDRVEHWGNALDPSFVQVVAGTFGKRQSLEFVADMGPFCHVVQV